MEDKKPTEVEKVIEMWTAYKEKGLEGIKEVGRRRDAEWRAEHAAQMAVAADTRSAPAFEAA